MKKRQCPVCFKYFKSLGYAAHRAMHYRHRKKATLKLMNQALRTPQTPYNELIFAVERKFPGETRHQTALRYIREAESQQTSMPAKPNNYESEVLGISAGSTCARDRSPRKTEAPRPNK